MKKEAENTIDVVCALLACVSLLLLVCWLFPEALNEHNQTRDELAFCKSICGHYSERKRFKGRRRCEVWKMKKRNKKYNARSNAVKLARVGLKNLGV